MDKRLSKFLINNFKNGRLLKNIPNKIIKKTRSVNDIDDNYTLYKLIFFTKDNIEKIIKLFSKIDNIPMKKKSLITMNILNQFVTYKSMNDITNFINELIKDGENVVWMVLKTRKRKHKIVLDMSKLDETLKEVIVYPGTYKFKLLKIYVNNTEYDVAWPDIDNIVLQNLDLLNIWWDNIFKLIVED